MKPNRLINDVLCLALPWIIVLGIFFYNKQSTLNKEFSNFVMWMKKHHYSKSIINIYECDYRNPALKMIIKDYLKIRYGDLRIPEDSKAGYLVFKNSQVLPLTFVEVVPTDEGARFEKIDPVVLEKFRSYLQERFGKAISISHKVVYKNYDNDFGDVFYDYHSMFTPKLNERLSDFVKQFPPPCLVRLDAEKLGGKDVAQIAEIRYCAIIMGQHNRLTEDLDIFDKYAHEFGHLIGLDHQFIDLDNLPRSGFDSKLIAKNKGKHLGIDDVMIKYSQAINPNVGRYLSPLSRYVLEPNEGYQDDAHFGQYYSALFGQEIISDVEKRTCHGW